MWFYTWLYCYDLLHSCENLNLFVSMSHLYKWNSLMRNILWYKNNKSESLDLAERIWSNDEAVWNVGNKTTRLFGLDVLKHFVSFWRFYSQTFKRSLVKMRLYSFNAGCLWTLMLRHSVVSVVRTRPVARLRLGCWTLRCLHVLLIYRRWFQLCLKICDVMKWWLCFCGASAQLQLLHSRLSRTETLDLCFFTTV